MAIYARKKSLVENTLAFKLFKKRFCDLNEYEKRRYNQISKNKSRQRQREVLDG